MHLLTHRENLVENLLQVEPPKMMIPGVYLLPEEQPHLENSNVFVIKGENGVALIDCGNVRNTDRISAALAYLDSSISDIKLVLLTDIHIDHCGAAEELQKFNPDIKVAVPQKGIVPLAKEDSVKTAWYLYDHLHDDYKITVPRIDYVVKDNDMFNFDGYKIKAMSTPGHSPASTTYIIDDTLAITGDLMHGGYNPYTIGSSMSDWMESLERLENTRFKLFADGHSNSSCHPFPRTTFISSCMKFGTQRMNDFKDLQILWP